MTKVKKSDKDSLGKNKLPKRMRKIYDNIDSSLEYSLQDALDLVKLNATAKFDETVEVVLNTGEKKNDQPIRGVVGLPHGLGKEVRVAVFARGDKAEEAQKAGADLVGADELVASIKDGKINFDTCIATPDMMPVISSVAKILGPRGLMPNPKLGTVTLNVAEAVKAAKSGQVEFKADKHGVVHAGFGKASFVAENLAANLKVIIDAIDKIKSVKTIKSAFITSTMGGSVKLDLSSLVK